MLMQTVPPYADATSQQADRLANMLERLATDLRARRRNAATVVVLLAGDDPDQLSVESMTDHRRPPFESESITLATLTRALHRLAIPLR